LQRSREIYVILILVCRRISLVIARRFLVMFSGIIVLIQFPEIRGWEN